GLPGKRLSSSSKRRRASHFAMKPAVLVACPQCKKQMSAHRACTFCGTYKGRTVTKVKTKTK
ncbi:MAG: 50S ribosomal protein L32, partial [Patescibacteria group bacterium]